MKGSRKHQTSPLLPAPSVVSAVASVFASALALIPLLAFAPAACAQSQAVGPEVVQSRITRARALAAAGNLPAARSELESLRGVQTDESVKEIALVLLMDIYFEQSDYAYAENLLGDAFRARSPQNEAATRAYFLLAGQAINGVRSQLDRYRTFGLDVSDPSLPAEAQRHLERLRTLVEHVVAQGRQLRDENARSIDAAALLESAASARVLLARNGAERAQWQGEVADVRQRLTGVERGAPQASLVTTQKPAPPQPAVGVTQAVPEPPPTTVAAATPQPAPARTNTTNTNATNTKAANGTGANATNSRPGVAATPARQEGAHASAPPPGATKSPAGGAARNASGAAQSDAGAKGSQADASPEGASQPVEVGSLIARASQTVAPTYPAAARTARIGGKVTVYLLIDEKGEVAAVQRTVGPEMLRRAAEEAARRWKFRPAVINNQPARVTGYVSFNFAP